MAELIPVTIAIPTYKRGAVLLETLEYLFQNKPDPSEIIIVDQTPAHGPAIREQLAALDQAGRIRWLRLEKPSIPAAMNFALLQARSPVVLFLDDDIIPSAGLIQAHAANYSDALVWGVSGQVLQPGQNPMDVILESDNVDPERDMQFPFYSTRKRSIAGCMAGNFSVRKDKAIMIGGFDENFVGDAYRFETEFCRRLIRNGDKIIFEPGASIRHLQVKSGGTRTYGSHMTSSRPELTSGDYYFALLEYSGFKRVLYIFRRLLMSLGRKFYLFHPWWLPVKLFAEMRGLLLAAKLNRRGPSYIGLDET